MAIAGVGALALQLLMATVVLAGPEVLGSGPARSGAVDAYSAEPAPLTVADCGRCHPAHFRNLRDSGGAHRFDCRDCHEAFHAYNPRRNNYSELMPQCSKCHSTPPHGPKESDCLACHENPHAPKKSLVLSTLASKCGDCHTKPAAQLSSFPSAHTKVACHTCHSERHGRIPVCFECHKPHISGQTSAACRACHPAHQPKEITLAADSDAKTCGACHGEVIGAWSSTKSKHGKVNCSTCHTKHGYRPECSACHKPPHDAKMLARFPSCLNCHLDVHNLPVR